ncbi:MAG: hypothetical protein IBX50_02430 [Marinospirillum sp.]|uniref:hypothetical protein n=1 Tax=Marinospirillum sp. TaxID=2183934 RepID=UPI0019F0AF84|nr:hypothetical protein [Marinospirillum sp.]MBE0505558.1 hypothetical protein [Marinospirillum sp.]
MKKTIFAIIVLLSITAQSALAVDIPQSSKPLLNAQVILQAEEERYRPSMNRILQTALDGLELYQTSISTQPLSTSIADRISGSRTGDAEYFALLQIESGEGRRGRNNKIARLQIYNTATGQPSLHWEQEYPRINDFQSLMSILSYELPLQLKRQYQQVAQVINISGREVFLDFDINSGYKQGDILRVFRDGEEIKDVNGVTFGKLQETVGVVQVQSVHAFYTRAEVIIGSLSIRNGHYAEQLKNGDSASEGRVLTVLEDQVAISIGSNVGVNPGSYYAVFRDVKPIGDHSAFRERVGAIVINEVHEDYAKGRFTLSNHHQLSKIMVNEGALVEEIDSPWNQAVQVGFGSYDLLGDDSSSIFRATWMLPSDAQVGLSYRLHAGLGDSWMLGAGLQKSLNYSPNFFTGIDFLYVGDEKSIGTNLFFSVEPPIYLWRNIGPVIDVGYMVGGDDYSGLNINLGLKVPLNW